MNMYVLLLLTFMSYFFFFCKMVKGLLLNFVEGIFDLRISCLVLCGSLMGLIRSIIHDRLVVA